MIAEMGIVNIDWAYLLLGLIAAFLLLKRSEGIRRERTNLLLGSATPPGGIVPVSLKIRMVAILALCTAALLAILRPYAGYEDVAVRSSGRDILAIIDVSNSMLAQDVSPSRLGLVKRKLLDLVRLLRAEGKQDRLGLLVFAGHSQLFAPLTADYAVLRNFVNALSPELVVQGGSDMEGALRSAEEVLTQLNTEQPLVLVFTDGTEEALPDDVLEGAYRGKNVPIVFFGVGTPEGSRIEVAPGLLVTDYQGRVVISKLNEEALRSAAERAGGQYLRSRLDEGDLLRALQLLKELRGGKELESSVRVYRELGPLLLKFALVGILLLAVSRRLSWVFPGLLLGALISSAATQARAEDDQPSMSLHEAWEAYQEGDYAGAKEGFAAELKENPDNLRVLQALASAEYKLGNLPESLKLFKKLSASATTERERFEGLYNQGNTELGLQRYDDAIGSYKQALKVRPGDENAEHNLAVAESMKKATPPPSSSSSSQESSNKSASNSSGSESSSSVSSSSVSSSSGSSDQSNSSDQGSSESNSDAKESSTDSASNGSASSSAKSAGSAGSSSASSNGASDAKKDSASSSRGSSEQQSEGNSNSSDNSTEAFGQSSSPHDAQALKEKEAKAWLDSLPDSPTIPRREGRRPIRQGVNTW